MKEIKDELDARRSDRRLKIRNSWSRVILQIIALIAILAALKRFNINGVSSFLSLFSSGSQQENVSE